LTNTSEQYQRSLDIVTEPIKHLETENSLLKGHKKDSNPVVFRLDTQDDGLITERAVDSFESCGSNLNTRIAKLVNKYSTASNSGSATAIHTGTTIQCPNPRNATTLVGASGSGPSAGASSSVPNNGHADGNTGVAIGSYGAHDNPHIRRSGPVNRSSPSKKDDGVSTSQIRNLSDCLMCLEYHMLGKILMIMCCVP
jgi:hypothetical protein